MSNYRRKGRKGKGAQKKSETKGVAREEIALAPFYLRTCAGGGVCVALRLNTTKPDTTHAPLAKQRDTTFFSVNSKHELH